MKEYRPRQVLWMNDNPMLERLAGRVLANGWPIVVQVAHAMVHGGPFPATSDGRSVSVGSLAIDRFLRPVCYHDLPAALLPPDCVTVPRNPGWWTCAKPDLTIREGAPLDQRERATNVLHNDEERTVWRDTAPSSR